MAVARRSLAKDFLKFVEASPSPFHAVEEAASRLKAAGFQRLSEKEAWSGAVKPGGKYYITRNQSALCAFAVGEKYEKGNGFSVYAAHTDSPCLKLKPLSASKSSGYLSVGVQTYGGGLWHTWFDRDLSVAGRVIVESEDGASFKHRLVRIRRPIMRTPTLAIHLNRDVNSKGFAPNAEKHLAPMLATAVMDNLNSKTEGKEESKEEQGDHHAILMQLLAKELNVKPSQIRDFELCLYDTQDPAIGGAYEEFVFAPRLDNLLMSYLGVESLVDSCSDGSLAEDPNVRVVALFDHEEIGSNSRPGAASTFLPNILERITGGKREDHQVAVSKSLLVSADMAHAIHPNYSEKHEARHRPEMHKGLVVKTNSNQRYATDAISAFILKQLAKEADAKMQEFVVRQDMGCGSTIGPILATKMGMRTIDVGVAQLSMHSIREVCGTSDLDSSYSIFVKFFSRFPQLEASIEDCD